MVTFGFLVNAFGYRIDFISGYFALIGKYE